VLENEQQLFSSIVDPQVGLQEGAVQKSQVERG